MRIEQSSLGMSAETEMVRLHARQEQASISIRIPEPAADTVDVRCVAASQEQEAPEDARIALLRWLAQVLLGGGKVQLKRVTVQGVQVQQRAAPRPQVEVRITSREVRAEEQRMVFETEGEVRTEDGRRFSFRSEFRMHREFYSETSSTRTAGNSVDPLALNFDGRGVRMEDRRASFDLDSDGQAEKVPVLGSGSGYLFLDRDRNGAATNGSELFGPSTGDGFEELAALDSNADGWLDENDPIFGELRLWLQSGGSVRTLAEAGVGAIGLARVASPFELTGENNVLLGEVRASGVYLYEDGRPGLIQQVDAAV